MQPRELFLLNPSTRKRTLKMLMSHDHHSFQCQHFQNVHKTLPNIPFVHLHKAENCNDPLMSSFIF